MTMSRSRKIRTAHIACMWGRRCAYKASVKKFDMSVPLGRIRAYLAGGVLRGILLNPRFGGGEVSLFGQSSQVMAPLNAIINSRFPWISWLTERNWINQCSWKCVFNCCHLIISIQIISCKLGTGLLVYCFVILLEVWLLQALQNSKKKRVENVSSV
jgi:hypothetical protein